MTTFTTSRGVTVEILAIQTLLEKFEAAQRLPRVPDELQAVLGDMMPKPDAPTYDVKALTGKVETFLHDETTVESEAERAAWAQYQADLAAYRTERGQKLRKLILLHGIKVTVPASDDWAKAQAELGIDVPTEATARKLHYIETEVCGGVTDFMELVRRCTMAGLPEEKLREAEALFQRSLGQYASQRTPSQAGTMDGELPVPASGDRLGVGQNPARV